MKTDYIFDNSKKPANTFTVQKNRDFMEQIGLLPLSARNPEYTQITQDCLLQLVSEEDFLIKDKDGRELVDLRPYYFIKESEEAPASVNPSLWQEARANMSAGVYGIVGKDVIQVRGIGVNTTLIRGKTGWVMVDVPSSDEAARAGILLAEKAVNESIGNHISAVIIGVGITDLYGNLRGGIRGATGGREVPVYAYAKAGITMTEENTYANVVNMRKQVFQFGSEPPGEFGFVTSGFTMGMPGGSSVYRPTHPVERDGAMEIDGLKIEVTLTPDIGTPSEMILYFEDYRVLWAGECLIGSLHNIYTVRGAKPRNANIWSEYLFALYTNYGDKAVAVLQSTNWPHKNTEEYPDAVKNCLLDTAAAYKWIHDQTLHYASKGYRPEEIAGLVDYPKELGKNMYVRPYYGSISLGAKGVYYSYFGNYDGSPVNLQKQDKQEEARQFIEYAGSVELVFEKAFADFENNKYQRAIEALDKIMFYDPSYEKARYLYADILEQLAYQAECGTWRNAYLNGAKELRSGPEKILPQKDWINPGNFVQNAEGMPDDLMLDYIGIALDGQKAGNACLEFQLNSKTEKEVHSYRVMLKHGVLLHSRLEDGTVMEHLPQIKAPSGILTKLVIKDIDSVKEYIETEHYGILKELETYLENPMDFLDYAILEKR